MRKTNKKLRAESRFAHSFLFFTFVVLILFIIILPFVSASQKTVRDLTISFAACHKEELVDYFNQIAREDDVLFFHEKAMQRRHFEDLIAEVKKGRIYYSFASWRRAEANVSYLKDKVDCFFYDLEKWENTPDDEWQNILYSSQEMARVTHNNGLCYVGALSYQLAKQPGAIEDMAEFTDIYVPHSHGFLRDDPEGYPEFLREQAQRAKEKNPDVIIEIMVSTAEGTPDVETSYNIISDCLDFADGVSIYNTASPESINKTKQLVSLMREGAEKEGDVNGNGVVDVEDLSIIRTNFGMTTGFYERADVNNDGVVNIHDLFVVANNFGT